MGLYDSYGNEQLNVGDVMCRHFRLGDEVEIDDGIYIGPTSAIVISHKVFIAEIPIERVFDKWGSAITEITSLINDRNPIVQYFKNNP